MYEVAAFRESRIEVMHALIRAHPLSTLVTVSGGIAEANHLPLLIDPDPSPNGTLRGHVARANPLWRQLPEGEVLAVFQGPQVYVTPSWYPSKREHGRVVPTWNYAVVHVRGPLVIRDDRAWLLDLVSRLTARQESPMPQPWAVGDAPADYIERMLEAIVGIEIPVARIEGKWKVSQNRSEADRAGVAAALAQADDPRSRAMAELVSGKRPV
ncbi:MAG: FMN-binding negative transcriptional regulator [Burkholderiales bacterium]|nr:FMN-binding negative transcriptional regulator [Burkholderiales bacterium]